MVLVNTNGKMADSIMENMSTIRNMAKELISGLMVVLILEDGRRADKMEKVSMSYQMER